MSKFEQLHEAVIGGNAEEAIRWVDNALTHGVDPLRIVKQGLQPSMIMVGEKFSSGEFFVPEMLFAAEAMKEALEVLRPRLAEADNYHLGKIVIGTVAGDLHDIGKNLVSMLLAGAGFEIIDLGTDVQAEQFVEAVRTHRPAIVALSALLTTTMPGIQATIETLDKAGLREQVKVIVGGAPVTERFAEKVGADGYAVDAGAAISVCQELLPSPEGA